MRSSKTPPPPLAGYEDLTDPLADLAASAAAVSSTSVPGSIAPLAGAPHALDADPGQVRAAKLARWARGPGGANGRSKPAPAGRLRRTLVACSVEGIFAEIVSACAGGAVLTGWALHLGCSPLVLALLSAMPFLGQLAHLPAAWLVASRSARKIAVASNLAARLCYLALALLPLLGVSVGAQRTILVATALVSGVLSIVGNNAWQVWMAEIVPQAIRGRYFGRRIAFCTAASAAASLSAAVLIDDARGSGNVGLVLSVLALIGSLAGVGAAVFMARQHETPRLPAPPGERFVARARVPLADPAARAFMAYQAAWNAANGLTAGFFAVYLLQELKTGFVGVAIHGLGMAAVRMIAAPAWGRLMDRTNPRVVLTAVTIGIAFLPLLWIGAAPGFLLPIALDAALGGVLLSGQALAGFALPMSLAPRRDRPFYVAAIALAGAPCFTVSAGIAGALLSAMPAGIRVGAHHLSALQALFGLAVLARFAVVGLSFEVLVPARAAFDALSRAMRTSRVARG